MSSRVKKGRRITKPKGAPGVDVERDGGDVTATFHDGMSSYVITWSVGNARMVASTINEAIDRGEVEEDVVLGSGLVVPGGGGIHVPK